jgi:hypothetical protein
MRRILVALALLLAAAPALPADPLANPSGKTLVIYPLELDGLPFGFFPCTSPRAFTPEQLAGLGSLDVAMISAETESDGRSAKKTFALARSVHARLIVTLTHNVRNYEFALEQIGDEGGKVEHVKDPLYLDAASLKDAPERVRDLIATATPE